MTNKILPLIFSTLFITSSLVQANPADILWTRSNLRGTTSAGFAVELTPNGVFIVLGNTSTDKGIFLDIWLLKTNIYAATRWTKVFNISKERCNRDLPRSLIKFME